MRKRTLFGPYEPDKAPFLQSGLVDVVNAYPTPSGYGPVGSFNTVTPALPQTFTGGGAFVDSEKNGTLVAGSSSALYRLTGSAWTTLTTGLTPSTPWDFTQFGDMVIAVGGSATQAINLTASTASALAGAPTAASVATVRDFVVYGGAAGNASLVQWSAFNDATGNTPGVNQAGYQPMLDGGVVQGIAGGEYGLIIQRRSVRRMTYIGASDDGVITPWQFDVIDPEVGALAAGSIAQSGRRVYFLSDRGFMYCDGNQVVPIGQDRIDQTFFKLHGRENLGFLRSAIDPRQSTVAWLVPGPLGQIWLYNWSLDRWSTIQLDASAMLSGFTTSVTLEDLNAIYPGGIETIPYSLDDPRFAGGDPLLLVVSSANAVGTLSGANMNARFSIQTEELMSGARSRIRFVRPITDADSGLTATVFGGQRLGGSESVVATQTLMPSGDMPIRADARFVSCQFAIDAGVAWSYAQGIEYEYEQGPGR